MRLLPLVLVCVVLGACNGFEQTLPDGGRQLLTCKSTSPKAPVIVLDRAGKPAADAWVHALNTTDGRNDAILTDGRGAVQISAELGPGVVKVSAMLNDLHSPEQAITFTCGACDCTYSPTQTTLQLQ